MHSKRRRDCNENKLILTIPQSPCGDSSLYTREPFSTLNNNLCEKAKEQGVGALCFEGYINFYGKSGLSYASEKGIRYHGLPDGADSSFFLCKELIHDYLCGITGEYATPSAYFVDEVKAEEIDKQFPYKEKTKASDADFLIKNTKK